MTSITPSSPRYGAMARALHWVLALALTGTFAVGLYMADLPLSPQRVKLYNWHKWAGVIILMLSVLRLLWRATHRPPALPPAIVTAMPSWQYQAYQATHVGLYALFIAVPLIGWAYSSAAGFPIVLLGMLPLPDFVSPDKALAALIKPWHQISAFALAGLVLLHVGAAIKHHWINKDGLLDRMLHKRR